MKLAPWLALPLISTLIACGREAPPSDPPSSPDDSPAQCEKVPCGSAEPATPQPTTTLTGYLVFDCAWQAHPSFTWAGRDYALDTFLSRERPTEPLPPACSSAPFTSRALLEATACKGELQCPPFPLAGGAYRLEGTYETVEVCMPTTMMGPLSCGPGQVFIPTHVSPSTATPAPALLAHYLFTAELAYEEVSLASDELVYTRFEDRTGKCATWIKQAPCWSSSDLIQSRAALSTAEASGLRAAIEAAGFFGLAGTLGGAGPYQRYYAVDLAALDGGGALRTVTYQSFPDATPMPDAFVASFKVLAGAVCGHFHLAVGGPFPPSAMIWCQTTTEP